MRPPDGTYLGIIYTDGSRIDGDGPRTARNGWAFAVIHATGRTLAIAFGTPLGWIEENPGTEAWVALQAAVGAEPG